MSQETRIHGDAQPHDKEMIVMELSRFPRSTPEAQGVRRTLTCRFSDDGMRVTQQANLSFGSPERPTLEERIAGGR